MKTIYNYLCLITRRKASFIKYIIVGAIAFTVEFSSFAALLYITKEIVIVNIISFLIGLSISFLLNKYWTFDGTQSNKTYLQFSIYALLAGFNLLVTTLFITVAVNNGLPAFYAKVFSMFAIIIWNFVIFKKIIFKVTGDH